MLEVRRYVGIPDDLDRARHNRDMIAKCLNIEYWLKLEAWLSGNPMEKYQDECQHHEPDPAFRGEMIHESFMNKGRKEAS